jgi:peroxiredoxin
MKKLFLIILLCLNVSRTQTIKINISNTTADKAYLSFLEGETVNQIDSIFTKEKGLFQFNLNSERHHYGIYRLSFDNNKWIDFVYDKEDIEIKTDANNITDNLVVVNSESNRLYYTFIKLNREYKTKSEAIQLFLSRYPKDDEFYITTQNKLSQLQKKYLNFVNSTLQKYPKSFIARYIRSSQLPVVDGSIPFDKQLDYLRIHSLEYVDFDDTELIYSDAFTNKTIEYLSYYKNPKLEKGQLEKEFTVAVDTLLNKAKVNQFVYKQVVEYLISGFKTYGFSEVIDYIVDNYAIKDNVCLDEKLETSIKTRLDQTKTFSKGTVVPDILLPDSSGIMQELYKINSENILIVFYASWCPHCKKLLPELNKLYKNQTDKKIEVFAVSMDTSKTDWLNFVKKYNFTWINVSDLKGGYGKASKDYKVYATPTMFLIDDKKEIISRPTEIEEIKNLIK